ncbi:MAG: polysaccharide biosynthesis protein [candidate division KSB1 bacterium]|nr:polysaccharide biosynthesis protein [candidate division KSB1 bacterium]MDZ7319505.1 polysaccharide biosynthesis protein [candidate division KSB1 bacterium]MDZ7342472.1 polysaccharide biosynthesis protein [candidate division KSB1 bacterium]
MQPNLKICIACSAGGHLKQAMMVAKSLNHQKYLVTYAAPHLQRTFPEIKTYLVTHSKRNPLLVLKNAIESMRILIKEKPDLIISTGADVAVPTCLIGKLMGARLIYIESGGQVSTPSLSGRIVYPFADLFLVQWKPALKNFPKAKYGGPLL